MKLIKRVHCLKAALGPHDPQANNASRFSIQRCDLNGWFQNYGNLLFNPLRRPTLLGLHNAEHVSHVLNGYWDVS